MANYHLRWRDCSGNYGEWRSREGYFIYRLFDDMLVAHVGISRYDEGRIEAWIEDKQRGKKISKVFKFKTEEYSKIKVSEAKVWAEKEMLNRLQRNIIALQEVAQHSKELKEIK